MNTLVVISSQQQYEAVIKNGIDLCNAKIFCDNPRMYGFLYEKGIEYVKIDDFFIPKHQWPAVNSWGCAKASEWIKISKERGFFKEYDIASSMFLRFGYIMVQMVRNYYYARRIISTRAKGPVIVFKFSKRPEYPGFSGNVFLNRFLSDLARENNIPVDTIDIVFKPDELLRGMLSFKSRIRHAVSDISRKIINTFYGRGIKPQSNVSYILVRGALKHLRAVIEEMKKRGLNPALYDYEFHKKSFDFAARHGIAYFIPQCFKSGSNSEVPGTARVFKDEIIKSIEYMSANGCFAPDGYDIGTAVKDYLYPGLESYCGHLARDIGHYKGIINTCDIKAVLLDEDTTPRNSLLAVFFKKHAINIFTASHATMAVNFSVPDDLRKFRLSDTFVNSDFEKISYAKRGWDPEGLVVTGIPRFDALVKTASIKTGNTAVVKKHRIVLFYCGASMKRYWPERGGYLGLHISNYGDAQRKSLKMIFNAVKGLPIDIVIKPHNYEGSAWEEFLQGESIENPVRLEHNTADFFKLLK